MTAQIGINNSLHHRRREVTPEELKQSRVVRKRRADDLALEVHLAVGQQHGELRTGQALSLLHSHLQPTPAR